MDVKSFINTFNVLNVDVDESTFSVKELSTKNKLDKDWYIVSDADEELLILVEFRDTIHLQSVTLYAIPNEDNEEEMSAPKKVKIYKIENANKNFDDIKSLKPDKSIKCSSKKLAKGQVISLTKTSKNAVKFQKTRYLAIFIESNQNEIDVTYLNGITFKGKPVEQPKGAKHAPNAFGSSIRGGNKNKGTSTHQIGGMGSESDMYKPLKERMTQPNPGDTNITYDDKGFKVFWKNGIEYKQKGNREIRNKYLYDKDGNQTGVTGNDIQFLVPRDSPYINELDSVVSDSRWKCVKCTFFNDANLTQCKMCNEIKVDKQTEQKNENDDEKEEIKNEKEEIKNEKEEIKNEKEEIKN
eukprot:462547_1